MKSIGNSFNIMADSVHLIVSKVQTTFDHLSTSSMAMSISSNAITVNTIETTANVQKIESDMDNSVLILGEMTELLRQFTSLLETAGSNAYDSEQDSQMTFNAATTGKDTMLETIACMNNIKKRGTETEVLLETLNKYSKQIGSINETITTIANQTN